VTFAAVVRFEAAGAFEVVAGFEAAEGVELFVGFEAVGGVEVPEVAGVVEVPGEFESVGVLLQPAKTAVELVASSNMRMSPLIMLGLRDFLFRRFAVF
jgi:hypothetical protein